MLQLQPRRFLLLPLPCRRVASRRLAPVSSRPVPAYRPPLLRHADAPPEDPVPRWCRGPRWWRGAAPRCTPPRRAEVLHGPGPAPAAHADLPRALRAEGSIDGLFAGLPHLPAPAVLELLTVLPEEAAQDGASDTGVDADARCRFTRELLAHAPAVLEFLHAQSEKADDASDGVPLHEVHRRVLRCLLSWVRVGCFSETPAAAHSILTFAFTSLQVSFSFDVAVEVMTELVNQHEVRKINRSTRNQLRWSSDIR